VNWNWIQLLHMLKALLCYCLAREPVAPFWQEVFVLANAYCYDGPYPFALRWTRHFSITSFDVAALKCTWMSLTKSEPKRRIQFLFSCVCDQRDLRAIIRLTRNEEAFVLEFMCTFVFKKILSPLKAERARDAGKGGDRKIFRLWGSLGSAP
jgi:hypothetical protein